MGIRRQHQSARPPQDLLSSGLGEPGFRTCIESKPPKNGIYTCVSQSCWCETILAASLQQWFQNILIFWKNEFCYCELFEMTSKISVGANFLLLSSFWPFKSTTKYVQDGWKMRKCHICFGILTWIAGTRYMAREKQKMKKIHVRTFQKILHCTIPIVGL